MSVYLISGSDGWTLLDTGYDYPPTYETWEAGAGTVGCDLDHEVARIIVPHFHPDHIGGARWLQGRTAAPVYLLESEISNARRVWDSYPGSQPFVEALTLYGIPLNVGLWPETEPRPLARYLDSLNGLRGLDAALVLPGYGPVFHDLDGRIAELTRHHDERLDEMRAFLDGGAKRRPTPSPARPSAVP